MIRVVAVALWVISALLTIRASEYVGIHSQTSIKFQEGARIGLEENGYIIYVEDFSVEANIADLIGKNGTVIVGFGEDIVRTDIVAFSESSIVGNMHFVKNIIRNFSSMKEEIIAALRSLIGMETTGICVITNDLLSFEEKIKLYSILRKLDVDIRDFYVFSDSMSPPSNCNIIAAPKTSSGTLKKLFTMMSSGEDWPKKIGISSTYSNFNSIRDFEDLDVIIDGLEVVFGMPLPSLQSSYDSVTSFHSDLSTYAAPTELIQLKSSNDAFKGYILGQLVAEIFRNVKERISHNNISNIDDILETIYSHRQFKIHSLSFGPFSDVEPDLCNHGVSSTFAARLLPDGSAIDLPNGLFETECGLEFEDIPTFKFAQIAPFSGEFAPLGSSINNGIQAAFTEHNKEAFKSGFFLHLDSFDDGYNVDNATEIFNSLDFDDEYFGIVGSIGDSSEGLISYVSDKSIPLIGPHNGAEVLRIPFHREIINIIPSIVDEMEALCKHFIDSLGLKRVAFIGQNNVDSISGEKSLKRALSSRNILPLSSQLFECGEEFHSDIRNATNQLFLTEKSRPEVIIFIGFSHSLAEVIISGQQNNYKGYYGGGSLINPDCKVLTGILESFNINEQIVLAQGTLLSQLSDDFSTIFHTALEERVGRNTTIHNFHLEGFLIGLFVSRMLNKARYMPNRERFFEAIYEDSAIIQLDEAIALGPFSSTCNQGFHDGVLVSYDSNDANTVASKSLSSFKTSICEVYALPECIKSFWSYKVHQCSDGGTRNVDFSWNLPSASDPNNPDNCSGGLSLPFDEVLDCEYITTDATDGRIMTYFSAISIGILVLAMILVLYNRNNRIIRGGQPMFLILGAIGMIAAIVGVNSLVGEPTTLSCVLAPSSFAIGFTTACGAMLVKMIRIRHIFWNKKLQKTIMSSKQMIQMMLLMILGMCLCLVLWISLDSPDTIVEHKEYSNFSVNEKVCDFSGRFMTLIVVYMSILIIVIMFFAFKIRKIPDQFNETKQIWAGIYNCMLAGIVAGIGIIFTSNHREMSFVIGLACVYMCLASQAGIMLPKMVIIWKRRHENRVTGWNENSTRVSFGRTTMGAQVNPKEQLEEANKKIEDLQTLVRSQRDKLRSMEHENNKRLSSTSSMITPFADKFYGDIMQRTRSNTDNAASSFVSIHSSHVSSTTQSTTPAPSGLTTFNAVKVLQPSHAWRKSSSSSQSGSSKYLVNINNNNNKISKGPGALTTIPTSDSRFSTKDN
eukprot:TRINITY_DN2018_c0_g4_i1.p1 TRINITY_DN2018_c0_g4~~TRINITY_DN2018_c0_g4_i1.p1  ORF type:complete len:1243 (-),score=282.60 TRINITY_DN2018_c0_g4_i1:801-4529(-)